MIFKIKGYLILLSLKCSKWNEIWYINIKEPKQAKHFQVIGLTFTKYDLMTYEKPVYVYKLHLIWLAFKFSLAKLTT